MTNQEREVKDFSKDLYRYIKFEQAYSGDILDMEYKDQFSLLTALSLFELADSIRNINNKLTEITDSKT